jgi:hypothetical protein
MNISKNNRTPIEGLPGGQETLHIKSRKTFKGVVTKSNKMNTVVTITLYLP